MPVAQTLAKNRAEPRPTATRAITDLQVEGMTCGNCARHVTDAIQSVPGVDTAVVSLDAHTAKVRWTPESTPDAEALIDAIEKEGFSARLSQAERRDVKESALAGWQINLLLGVPVTVSLMLGEWVLGLSAKSWFQWFSFLAAGAVQAFAGARFYRGAWAQLRRGSSNMDTLVALGSSTAFAYSAWSFLSGHAGHLYFMEAAAIITLISVGHWMESRVSVRASSALRGLLDLAPALARRRNADGREADVPVSDLVVGDRVVLRPGNKAPTDGRVLEGASAVDESMLTGESVPVDKAPGAELYAGTLNVNGRLLMEVTATGQETALANIIAAVQRAQSSRATIQRIGDRVSNVFVPIVVAIAVLAACWWGLAPASAADAHAWLARFLWPAHPPGGALAAAFIIASGVLIIACPCAMGLATPAAIMAGSNAAAQRGILIRDGVALEKAGAITSVVFDKTGTLTQGKPALAKSWIQPGMEIFAPKMASSLAAHSTHPISLALAGFSESQVGLEHWQEIQGSGLEAKLPASALADTRDGAGLDETWRLGSIRWLEQAGVKFEAANAFATEWSGQGATLVGLAAGSSLVGLFAIRDALKPGADQVVRQLAKQGMRVYLVTGDSRATAQAIARQAGIPPEFVHAEVRPEEKAARVKALQQQGERVAFVGDGINDAPALEQADLGIGVSKASDVAREAADIILLKSDIHAVPESLGLARATLRIIKQNLFWAFFYNALGIPLAALGFMSPILCAAAMGVSDLVVIGNALRLRGWTLKDRLP